MAGISNLLSFEEQDPSELNEDRISFLPWNVLDVILGKLSIIEAARTSVLAKDWQYKWLSISNLTIDYGVIARVLNKGYIGWEVFSSIINRFLLHRTSTIRKFYLSAFCMPHYSDVYPWIHYLSNLDVEVLFLQEIGNQQRFDIPSNIFSFKKLQRLYLGNCILRLPSTFGGFNSIREISLSNVSINEENLYHMIRAYPLLVKLVLLRMPGVEHLRIYAPRLTMLVIDTNIEDVVIEMGACLVSFCIQNALLDDKMIQNWESVIRCLSSLDALQSLVLFGDFIKVLATDFNLENLQLRNGTVTRLSLCDIRLDTIKVIRVCLSLLSSCRNIRTFQFSVQVAKGPNLFTPFLEENRGRFSFPLLNSILVMCPYGSGMEGTVNFIKFLCAHSPNLKVLSIKKGGERNMNTTRISKMLSQFKKICPHASIKYTYYRKVDGHTMFM